MEIHCRTWPGGESRPRPRPGPWPAPNLSVLSCKGLLHMHTTSQPRVQVPPTLPQRAAPRPPLHLLQSWVAFGDVVRVREETRVGPGKRPRATGARDPGSQIHGAWSWRPQALGRHVPQPLASLPPGGGQSREGPEQSPLKYRVQGSVPLLC